MAGTETELKLAVDTQALERLKRHRLVQVLKQGRPETRRLVSVYFDTPSLRLLSEGLTLRLRQDGRRRLMTLKEAGTRAGGLFARMEAEAEIDGDIPDPALLGQGPWSPLLADPAISGALAPVFSTEVRRSLYRLAAEDWAVELAFDEGEIVAGERRAPLAEVELELRQGSARHLFDLALALHEAVPVRVLSDSKSDRGFALLRGEEPQPVKAKPLPLDPALTVAQAFQAIARTCLAQLQANEAAVLQRRDPEGVHQMRVALRRFRSALEVFKAILANPATAALRNEMKWLLSCLGPARDTDVFLAEIIAPVAAEFHDQPAMALLKGDFESRRDEHYATVAAALAAPRYTTLLLKLAAWIEAGDWLTDATLANREILGQPVAEFAAKVLDKRDRKLRKAGRRLAELAPPERHHVRILTKRLRYAGEFFSSLWPDKRTRRYLAALADLQDTLGMMNDIAVARLLLAEHAEKTRDPDRMLAGGLITGWHSARNGALLERAVKDWRDVEKTERFWRR